MRLGNVIGMNANRLLKVNNGRISKSMEKLSSGSRINRASDDVAGISISEGMKAQIRGLKQASRNTQDTISMIQTAEGGLEEVTSLVHRMRELSVMALNDTLTDEDRYLANKEFVQLRFEVDRISEDTEFNTKSSYEGHEPTYEQITGNRIITPPVEVINGYNSELILELDGEVKTVNLEPGLYTVSQFMDMFDDVLHEIDKNVLISLNEDGTMNISAENYNEISISGGATSLIYDYHIGQGFGTVYGTSDLSGTLYIVEGSNDKFSFYAGGEQYTVEFEARGYTADEIVEKMQDDLDSQNAGVKVYMRGNNIALDAGNRTIDGFSGNMIKIDGITSILYDNSFHGFIQKTQGYVRGGASLLGGITIDDSNDTIKLKLDGSSDHEIKLGHKTYGNLDELIDEVNSKFEASNIEAKASKDSNRLRITSDKLGSGSRVTLDATSNSYHTLFREVNSISSLLPGRDASIIGVSGSLDESIEIVGGKNDEILIVVDGVNHEIKLDPKTYTREDLISEINSKASLLNLNITASLVSNGISLKHNGDDASHTIRLDGNSNSYKDLFCSEYMGNPTINSGKTTPIPGPEGTTEVTYEHEAASVQGRTNISFGVEIDSSNDVLSFKVNGQDISITLDHGSYNGTNASQLAEDIESKVRAQGMDNLKVSIRSNGLYFETIEKGANQRIDSFSGSAYDDILRVQYNRTSTSSQTNRQASISSNSSPINIVDGQNSRLEFKYKDVKGGVVKDIGLDIPVGQYTSQGMADFLNGKFLEMGVEGDLVADVSGGTLHIRTKKYGSDHLLSDFSGGFYDEYLNKSSYGIPPLQVVGTTNPASEHKSYIVGRKSLTEEAIEISPNINDRLIFDYEQNGEKETISITLDPGLYSASEVVDNINSKLDSQGIDKVYAQVGGVSTGTNVDDSDKLVLMSKDESLGKTIIDGVRGSAAYSVFYNSVGIPVPTHVLGVKDIASGIEIVEGENDIFIFSENGEPRELNFPKGSYSQEGFLSEMNGQLQNLGSSVIASEYEGKLKLSFDEIGYNTIDNIRGNGKGLIFGVENRDGLDGEYYQLGANAGQNVRIDKEVVSAMQLRISTVHIETPRGADKALRRLDLALGRVVSSRSNMGVLNNRLEHSLKNTENYAENLQASESRIRDVDMAKEMLELSRAEILEKASQMVLSQSKQNADSVIQLLM